MMTANKHILLRTENKSYMMDFAPPYIWDVIKNIHIKLNKHPHPTEFELPTC